MLLEVEDFRPMQNFYKDRINLSVHLIVNVKAKALQSFPEEKLRKCYQIRLLESAHQCCNQEWYLLFYLLKYWNMVVFLGKVICRYKIIIAHPVKLLIEIPPWIYKKWLVSAWTVNSWRSQCAQCLATAEQGHPLSFWPFSYSPAV